jgi:hypothetical protein
MTRPHKGKPQTDWQEPKNEKINVSLTSTGKRLAKARAEEIGLSISEVIERWARRIPVDSDDAIVTPSDQIPSVKSILESLPRYSRHHLTQFVWAALKLLIYPKEEEETTKKPTIATFVLEHQTACLLMFEDAVAHPTERINHIIAGGEPTLMELSLLSACLPIDDDELMKMYKKEFPNGNDSTHQGSLRDH